MSEEVKHIKSIRDTRKALTEILTNLVKERGGECKLDEPKPKVAVVYSGRADVWQINEVYIEDYSHIQQYIADRIQYFTTKLFIVDYEYLRELR